MSDTLTILKTQLEQMIQLYQHEDRLTWQKIQQAVYLNGALATILGVELVNDMKWLIALVGTMFGILFIITIEGSRRYMFARLTAIRKAEARLCELGGVTPLIDGIDTPWWLPTTSLSIRTFLWTSTLVWTGLCLYLLQVG